MSLRRQKPQVAVIKGISRIRQESLTTKFLTASAESHRQQRPGHLLCVITVKHYKATAHKNKNIAKGLVEVILWG